MGDIYHSGEENINPCDLLKNGYNSFTVHIKNTGADILYFGKEIETNYLFDPYTENDVWSYETFTADFPTNFSRNTQKIHNYVLNIRMNNILNNNLN
jgi:hypothetical protein